MTYKEALALKREVEAHVSGPYCTVPRGRPVDGYVVKVGPLDAQGKTVFHCRQDALDYLAAQDAQWERIMAEAHRPIRDTRSPLDRMIDQACGR